MQRRFIERHLSLVLRQFLLVLQVLLLFASADLVQWRLGNKNVSALKQWPHLTEEKGQQQGADMRSIDIGIGHDNDAVVTQGIGIKLLRANTTTKGLNQRTDFGGAEH